MHKKYDYVIVLASGGAERVKKYTFDGKIPKILMSIGNDTLFSSMMKNIKDVGENVFVTLNDKHIPIVDEVDQLTNNIKPEYFADDGEFSTGHTLYRVIDHIIHKDKVNRFLTKKSVLVVWSDILEKETESLKPLTKLIDNFVDDPCTGIQVSIGLDNNPRHRYNKSDTYNEKLSGITNVESTMDGNVVGCYAFNDVYRLGLMLRDYYGKSFISSNRDTKYWDLIDAIKHDSETSELLIVSSDYFDFIDIGDSEKYNAFMKPDRIKTRFFNKLENVGDTLVKTATNEKGKSVMENEIDYFNFLEYVHKEDLFVQRQKTFYEYNPDATIKNIGYSMEILKETVQEKIERDVAIHGERKRKSFSNKAYDEFKAFIKKLHSDVISNDEIMEMTDAEKVKRCLTEYVDVTRERYQSIKHLIEANKVRRFNGHPVPDFDYMMMRLEDYINVYGQSTSFGLIHGDTNSSNVMYDDKGNLKLIDPRGHFAGHLYFGDINYDYAKFLYGIGGYYGFNNHLNFKFEINDYEVNKQLDYMNFDRIIPSFDMHESDIDLFILVSVIWLKLPAYIINNPMKAVYAYYLGITKLDQHLKHIGF